MSTWELNLLRNLTTLTMSKTLQLSRGPSRLLSFQFRPFCSGQDVLPKANLGSRLKLRRLSVCGLRYSSGGPVVPTVEEGASIRYEHGLPHLTITLPSRGEKCIFVLRPVTHTVGDLLGMLRFEDRGIDRAFVRNRNGVRVASATSIQTLMAQDSFDLVINDNIHQMVPPSPPGSALSARCHGVSGLSEDEVKRLGDVRALVGQLYEALHVQEHEEVQERRLIEELEALTDRLAPMEEQRKMLAAKAERRTVRMTWLGLGTMGIQFGILARLTWWEYSWDIMEPVTYFVTYGTAVACYAYFVLTKQDYVLPDVRDRQFLLSFYKKAKKHDWDVEHYNELKNGIVQVEEKLRRLRDPLRVRLNATKSMSRSVDDGTKLVEEDVKGK